MTETWSALYTFKHLGSAFPCPSLPPPPLPSSSRSLSSPGSPCPTQLLSLSCRCLWNRAFKNAAFWINESFFARCRRERRRRGEEVGDEGSKEEGVGANKYRVERVSPLAIPLLPLPDVPPRRSTSPHPTQTHTHIHTHAFAFLPRPSTPSPRWKA